jgi:G3E family GTPase
MPDTPKLRPVKTGALADLPDHGFNSIALQFEQPLDLTKTTVVLQNLIELHGSRLVRLKGLIFDPNYEHPLLVQGSTGVLHPAAHLPARASDDFVSRLVFIFDGPATDVATGIAHEFESAFYYPLSGVQP